MAQMTMAAAVVWVWLAVMVVLMFARTFHSQQPHVCFSLTAAA
jgi:hypothetical protein